MQEADQESSVSMQVLKDAPLANAEFALSVLRLRTSAVGSPTRRPRHATSIFVIPSAIESRRGVNWIV